ncbi:MAG: secretin and TonB N-terminal domain-containing protein [Desulfobacterales bacterium]|nr:secretin and TonB N-terminal domain-containing protein [Desulfobacterales bacterium]
MSRTRFSRSRPWPLTQRLTAIQHRGSTELKSAIHQRSFPIEPRFQSNIINTDACPEVHRANSITLDFQNADIHNILRIIADVSGLNIVTSDEVKGTVTIRLKDVPWDQALDVVLESKDLDKMAIGNVVRIAPADKIKQAQERQLASKKTKEQLEPLVTSVIPVNFAKASEISGTIKGKEVGLHVRAGQHHRGKQDQRAHREGHPRRASMRSAPW